MVCSTYTFAIAGWRKGREVQEFFSFKDMSREAHTSLSLISLNVIIRPTPYCKGVWEMSLFQAATHLTKIQGLFYCVKERIDMRG